MATQTSTDLKQDVSKTPLNEIPSKLIKSLSFEDTAEQLAALKALIFNSPDTNQAKITFLQEEIATGRYQIESNEIASKLVGLTSVQREPEMV